MPEKTMVSMACKNFQLGLNTVVVRITEDNDGIDSAADVVQGIFGTSFNFGSSNYDTNKTAEYTFTFDVVLNCSFRDDMKTHIRTDNNPGRMRFFGKPYDEIMEKIEEEYIEPVPPVQEEEVQDQSGSLSDGDNFSTNVPDGSDTAQDGAS